MKKVISIFLFACLTAPFVGSYTWLSIQKSKIRKEIKHSIRSGLPKEDLILFAFSSRQASEQLKWEKADEFEYQSQMYDVVITEVYGDSVNYWCFLDKKETKLNNHIKELVANTLGKDPQKKEAQKRLISFLQTCYCMAQSTWSHEDFITDKRYPSLIPAHCLLGYMRLNVPPPKVG